MRGRGWIVAGVLALLSSARAAPGSGEPSAPGAEDRGASVGAAVATAPSAPNAVDGARADAFRLLEGQEVARQLPLRDLAWHVLGYTEDGARLLAADAAGAALLDDRGQVRARLTCPQAEGSAAVDVSGAPDRAAVAVRYADGRVCVWDGAGQALLGAPGKDTTAAVAASDDLVVLGFADGRLEGRSTRAGARRWRRNPELGPIVHLRFEAGGPRVAASTGALGVAVVDTRNGRLVRALRGAPAFSATFDPMGSMLAVGRANGRVELWDTTYWMARRTVHFGAGTVVDLDYSPDGSQLAAALERGEGADRAVVLEVYDLVADELVLRETAPAGPGPTRARYDAVGDRLVVGNGPDASRMWSRPGARSIPRPPPSDEPPHQRPFADPLVLPDLPAPTAEGVLGGALAVTADGARALVRDAGGLAVRALTVEAGASGDAASVRPNPTSAAPNAPGALAGPDATPATTVPLVGSDAAAPPFAVSPDGGRVAAWSGDRLLVWDGVTGALLGRVAVGRPHAVALLGERLAIATEAGKLYAGTLQRLRAVPDAANVTAVALDPFHAERVGIGVRDGGVRILDARTGASLGAWGVHAGAVSALVFSPDGRLLATAAPRPAAAPAPAADPADPLAAVPPSAPGARLVVLGTDRADEEVAPWAAVLDAVPARLAFDPAGERVLAVSPTTLAVSTRAGLVLDISANVVDAGFVTDGPVGGVRWVDATGAVRRVATGDVLPAVPRGRLLARSDDGRFAVTVDVDRVSVWNDRDGRLLRDLPAVGQAVRRAVFDDAGNRLAVLYADATVEVYEVATGEALRNLDGPPAGAETWMRFSEDGALLWAFAGPPEVVARDVATGAERARVVIPGEGPLALDPATARGRFVRFSDAAGDAWLDTHAASPKRLTLPSDGFRPVAVAPSGRAGTEKWLAAVQEGAIVRLDATTQRRVGPLMHHPGDAPGVAAAVSADGAWLAAAYASGLVRVWEVETGKVAASLGADARLLNRGPAKPVASLAFDGAGELLTARDATGYPRLWEWRLSVEAPAVGTGAGPVLPSGDIAALAVSPDGRTLYSAHGDWNARAWDLATGAQTNFFWAHAGPITTLAVAGSRLVTGAEDGTVRAWDTATAVEKLALNTFGDPVRRLAVSPDGWRVAAVGDGAIVRTWDAARGKALRRWAAANPLLTFELPTAAHLEVMTHDGVRWRLDPVTGAAVASDGPQPLPPVPEDAGVVAVRAFAEALSPVTAAVRTPDGRTYVTAGLDGRIRLWDLETRALRATLRAMTDGSWIVDRADGTRHASESLRDGTSPRLYKPPPR